MRINYAVFKGGERNSVRLGVVQGQQRAIDLMERMYARLPGNYYVLSLENNAVIAFLPSAPGNTPPTNESTKQP